MPSLAGRVQPRTRGCWGTGAGRPVRLVSAPCAAPILVVLLTYLAGRAPRSPMVASCCWCMASATAAHSHCGTSMERPALSSKIETQPVRWRPPQRGRLRHCAGRCVLRVPGSQMKGISMRLAVIVFLSLLSLPPAQKAKARPQRPWLPPRSPQPRRRSPEWSSWTRSTPANARASVWMTHGRRSRQPWVPRPSFHRAHPHRHPAAQAAVYQREAAHGSTGYLLRGPAAARVELLQGESKPRRSRRS